MDLVPIPPPRIGEFKMDVAFQAGGVRLVIRDPEGGEAIRQFTTVHERPFHLFIVGHDLAYFAHEHPHAVNDGAFEMRRVLPPGEYMLIADFLPQGGTPQILQRAVVTPDYRGALFRSPRELDVDTSEKEVEGTRIRLEGLGLAARRRGTLRFTLTDVASDKPVDDLEPFLGSPGHMLIVTADLTEAFHVHPDATAAAGAAVTFEPMLPAPGKYRLWVQFQRRGKVLTAPFAIEIRE